MRIALIHSRYQRQGGAETYFLNLVAKFAAAGHHIDIYIYKYDKQLFVPDNVKIRLYYRPGLPRILKKWHFAHWVYKQLKKHQYDITLSNTHTIGQQLLVCGGCHVSYLERLQKRSSLKNYIRIALERRAYQSSECIIAHSKQVASELIEYFPEFKHKVATLYPPCDLNVFKRVSRNKRADFKNQFGMSSQHINLVFPSSGNKKMKGHYLLLEAMELLETNRYTLFLAGLNEQPNRSNVRALGFVKDMSALFSAADLLILPSYYEAFGLVVVEALACGTPVVVSKYVGSSELITDKEGIIYQQQSPQILAEAIEEATKKKFDITEYFVQKNQLTIDQHITALKALGASVTDAPAVRHGRPKAEADSPR